MGSRLDALPYEMITYIFQYLSYVAILRTCKAYPQLRHLLKDEHFWEQKCLREVKCSSDQFADTYGDAHHRYLRMLSIGPGDSLSISEGSEMYLPIDKCLRRAVRLRDNSLINYFLARFPLVINSKDKRMISCVQKVAQRGFRKLALHLTTKYQLDPNVALLGGALGNDLIGIDRYVEAGADPALIKEDRLSSQVRDYLFQLDFEREATILAYTEPPGQGNNIIEKASCDGKTNFVMSHLRKCPHDLESALRGVSRGGHLKLLADLVMTFSPKAHQALFATLEAIEYKQTDCAIFLLDRYPTNSVVPLIRASILGNADLLYYLTSRWSSAYSIDTLDSARRSAWHYQHTETADVLEMVLSVHTGPTGRSDPPMMGASLWGLYSHRDQWSALSRGDFMDTEDD